MSRAAQAIAVVSGASLEEAQRALASRPRPKLGERAKLDWKPLWRGGKPVTAAQAWRKLAAAELISPAWAADTRHRFEDDKGARMTTPKSLDFVIALAANGELATAERRVREALDRLAPWSPPRNRTLVWQLAPASWPRGSRDDPWRRSAANARDWQRKLRDGAFTEELAPGEALYYLETVVADWLGAAVDRGDEAAVGAWTEAKAAKTHDGWSDRAWRYGAATGLTTDDGKRLAELASPFESLAALAVTGVVLATVSDVKIALAVPTVR